jgi:hypothetical protein
MWLNTLVTARPEGDVMALIEDIRRKILLAETDRLAGQWPATRIVILESQPGGRHRKGRVTGGVGPSPQTHAPASG